MRILLNTIKKDNYIFIDKESRAYCDLSSPLCIATHASAAVLRGIEFETIIDVDNVTGIEFPEKNKAMHDAILRKHKIARVTKENIENSKQDKLNEGKDAIEKLMVDDPNKEETEDKKVSKVKKAAAKKDGGEE